MKTNLTYLYEERYGGGRGCINGHLAIDKHCTRVFEDKNGVQYHLDRDLSICPPCFEALGPIPSGFQGVTPVIEINGNRYFGDGISWEKALPIFFAAVDERAEGNDCTPESCTAMTCAGCNAGGAE